MTTKGGKTTVANKELIELYKTTLEELRHYDATNTQGYVGIVIVIPIFLTAVSFLLGENSPVGAQSVLSVKWGLFILALLFTGFFVYARLRLNQRVVVCNNVLKKIEARLIANSIPKALLIRGRLNKTRTDGFLTNKVLGIQLVLWIYVLTALAFLAASVSLIFFLM
jgi:hypothetical protein